MRLPDVGKVKAKILPAARTISASDLPDRATIRRPEKVQKPSGGWAETLTAIATNRPCRVTNTQRQAQEETAGGEIRNIKSRDIRMRWDEDVRDTDTIVVTQMNGAACSKTFQVLDAGDVSDMVIRVVQCKQIS
jgi:hypothetical protein